MPVQTRSLGRPLTRPLVVAAGAEAPAVLPSDIRNLRWWLEARFIPGLADGASVATWPDMSRSGYDATQATGAKQPVHRAGVLAGQPVVRFNGSSQYLQALGFSALSLPLTVFVVASQSGAAGSQRHFLFLDGPSGTLGMFWSDSSTNLFLGDATNTWTGLIKATPALPLAIYSGQLVPGGGTSSLWANGALQVTNTGTISATLSQPSIGAAAAPSNYWAGDIAAIILYDRALSATERDQVQQYLAQTYGLSVQAA